MVVARVFIVRHGETHSNRAGILQGQLDTELNKAGFEQAKQVAEALQEVPFDLVFSSDLRRASDTADEIVRYHPSLELRKSDKLRERGFGDLEGQAVSANAPLPDNAEKADVFARRAVDWWNRTILQGSKANNPDFPRHILVVSHGGWIGTLLRTLVGSRKMTCAKGVVIGPVFNASITVVEVDAAGKGVCVSFGDVYHLIENVVEKNADEIEL